ncbi:Long-chain-fatty-acid--CoA ligase [Amycolatopsis sp. YIM 10]|nr:Long-chain-fatty-acid--CoA ligase [Amycolatopsis sp. YIM 10]
MGLAETTAGCVSRLLEPGPIAAGPAARPGEHAEPRELIDYCSERLAAYKYPRSIEVLDELPKTVSGKILRRELRARG